MTVAVGAGLILAACQSEGSLEGDDDDTTTTTIVGVGGMNQGGAGGATTTTNATSGSANGTTGGTTTGNGGMGSGGMGSGGMGSSSSSVTSTSAYSSAASSTSASSSASTGSGGGPLTYDNCGFANDGPWMQIDYGNAYTITSPTRTYSNTPGFGEAQWNPNGQSFPEVWFIGGGSTQVSNDPIGKIAHIGPGAKLQMMIGLGSLISYSHATVCVEGRSVSTSASVLFDAYNPKNNCGMGGQMSHSWAIHATGIDIGNCLLEGDAFQAVRLEPWGGSSHLGVRRVRVTLHNAVY